MIGKLRNEKNNRSIPIIIFVLSIIFLSSFAYADIKNGYDADNGRGSSYLGSFQYSGDEQATNIPIANDKTPILCDVDGDFINEVIGYNENNVRVYELGGSGYELVSQKIISGDIYSLGCISDDTEERIVVAYNSSSHYKVDELYLSSPTSTTLTTHNVVDYNNASFVPEGSFGIDEFSSGNNFYVLLQGSDNTHLIYDSQLDETYIINTGTVFKGEFSDYSKQAGGTSNFAFDFHTPQAPVISYFGSRVYYIKDNDEVARYYYGGCNDSSVCNPSVSTITVSGDGIIELMDIVGLDRQNNGATDACYYWRDFDSVTAGSPSARAYIECIDDGIPQLYNEILAGEVYSQSGGFDYMRSVTSPLIAFDIDNDGNKEMCLSGSTIERDGFNTVNYKYFSCLEENGDVTEINVGGVSTSDMFMLSGIGYIQGTNDPYFIGVVQDYQATTDDYIFFTNLDNGTYTNFVEIPTSYTGFTVLNDINSDSIQEMYFQLNNTLYTYAIFSGQNDTITVNPFLDYSGLFGFYNPACSGNITFKGEECVDSFSSCTYNNDNVDPSVRERLCTTCGGEVTRFCGDWSYTQPQVTCDLTAGTYNIDIELETSTAPGDVAYTFDDFSLTVSDTECDEENDFVDVPDESGIGGDGTVTPPSSDGELSTEVSFVTSIQNNIKLIIGVILIFIVVAFLVQQGVRNPIILLLGAIGGTIIATALGLFTTTVLVLMLGSIVVLIFLSFTVFKPSVGGD